MDLPKLPEGFDLWTAAFCLWFSGFGGLMAYLLDVSHGNAEFKWLTLVVRAGSSAFAGMLVMLGCSALHWDPLWTGLFAGVAGWIGAEGTSRIFQAILFKRFGIARDDVKEE